MLPGLLESSSSSQGHKGGWSPLEKAGVYREAGGKEAMQAPWVDVKGFPLVSPGGPSESPSVRPEISHHGADRGVREIELPSDVGGLVLLQETNRQTDGPDVRRGGGLAASS